MWKLEISPSHLQVNQPTGVCSYRFKKIQIIPKFGQFPKVVFFPTWCFMLEFLYVDSNLFCMGCVEVEHNYIVWKQHVLIYSTWNWKGSSVTATLGLQSWTDKGILAVFVRSIWHEQIYVFSVSNMKDWKRMVYRYTQIILIRNHHVESRRCCWKPLEKLMTLASDTWV